MNTKILRVVVVVVALLAGSFPASGSTTAGQSDEDGSSTSYPAVVRDNADWFLRDAHTSGEAERHYRFGPGGAAVVGDWNGDGERTPGWFRDGVWYLRAYHGIGGPPDYELRYGKRGDIPVVGHWKHNSSSDDSRVDMLGVVRVTDRGLLWLLETDTDNGEVATDGRADVSFYFGSKGDLPVSGRWEEARCASCPSGDFPGVVRRGERLEWYLETDLDRPAAGPRHPTSDGQANHVLGYGSGADTPVVGDWDGDGIDNLAVVRGNRWLLDEDWELTRDGRRRVATDGRHDATFRYGVDTDTFLSFTGTLTEERPADTSGQSADDLWGRTFVAVSIEEGGRSRELESGTRLEVTFERRDDGDDVVRWNAGCNTMGGPVTVTRTHLELTGPVDSTAMGCSEELHDQDEWITEFFGTDPRWELDGDRLTLWSRSTTIHLEG